MSRTIDKPFKQGYVYIAVFASMLFLSGPASAADKQELPETTTDGLSLATKTDSRIVYKADDVDLSQYTRVMLIDSYVAFEKNWQRDYNRDERDLSRKVSDSDVTRIKETLAKEFKEEFTKALEKAGHEVVTEPAADVLIVRPAIINVSVTAPDTRSASRSRSYVADPGQMTLYLELYDSVSSAILAKIMDAQDAGRGAPMMSYSNRSTNIAAADRIIKAWANELADHLGEVKGK